MPVPTLSLDLGQHLGWVLRRHDGTYTGSTYDFSAAGARIGLKYHYFRAFLIRTAKEVEGVASQAPKLGAVIYEKVQFSPKMGGLMAAQSWAGMEAILTGWCEFREIPYIGVPVGTLKKHFTGNGRASKEDMVHTARALGWRPFDDNHADAIALQDFYEVHHEDRAPRRVVNVGGEIEI